MSKMRELIQQLISFVVNTPIYPHWLEFRNIRIGNGMLYSHVKGDVLETGCGNGDTKRFLLSRYGRKIRSYLATDYSSWDAIFEKHAKRATFLGMFSELLFGRPKTGRDIDRVCSALDLPFDDKSFDTYCSFEVLEHIHDPQLFFKEAYRVLRKKGKCLLSVPFLYREHSEGTGYDYFRYTKSGLKTLAERAGFSVQKIFAVSFYGTTMATLINQYLIRKIMERKHVFTYLLFFVAPFIFSTTNTVGYLIDLFDPDDRFATRYHVLLEKK